MDLTIETKEFIFSLDGTALALIVIFMSKELNTCVQEGIYHLTKKEIKRLIQYLEEKKEEFNNIKYYTFTLDNFMSMYMLMYKNEKAKFKFW